MVGVLPDLVGDAVWNAIVVSWHGWSAWWDDVDVMVLWNDDAPLRDVFQSNDFDSNMRRLLENAGASLVARDRISKLGPKYKLGGTGNSRNGSGR